MGGPMAMNVYKHFPRLVVFDAQPTQGLAALRDAGAAVALSAEEIFAHCDIIILSLPDSAVVEKVLSTAATTLQLHALIIDTSTTTPETSRRCANALGHSRYIDSPVTGEQRRAVAGTLTAMVGGPLESFQRAKPVINAFASTVVHAGSQGSGQLCKAINNALYNVSCAAMAEALTLAEASGLPPAALAQVVSKGSGQSFGFDKFAPLVLKREFGTGANGYPMGAAIKDMDVVAQTARAVGAELDVVAATRRTYEAALRAGLGHESKGAMVKVWEQRLGVMVGQARARL